MKNNIMKNDAKSSTMLIKGESYQDYARALHEASSITKGGGSSKHVERRKLALISNKL